MSTISRIRWRNKDVRQLRKLVKSYNDRIDKVAKEEPEKTKFLPKKTTYEAERAEIVTRNDFDFKLKSLQNVFGVRATQVVTTPAGFNISNYELDEARRINKRREAKKTSERKKLIKKDEISKSKIRDLGLTPKPFDIGKIRSRKEFDKFVESAERAINLITEQEKLEAYKENYIKGIVHLGIKEDEIRKRIDGLSLEDLFDLTVADDELNINFYYEEQEGEAIAERILERFDELL